MEGDLDALIEELADKVSLMGEDLLLRGPAMLNPVAMVGLIHGLLPSRMESFEVRGIVVLTSGELVGGIEGGGVGEKEKRGATP